ncbi:MAG TPA: GWxTD domain-containing protein [Thermoanaerobaculia bacterium]|nr:GWxTD domain-containing protein [Thermoanaerobaculia bacterium]
MRSIRLVPLVPVLAVCAALALPAGADPAQLSDAYREWGEGPASWLMTPDEEAAWQRVASDEEAEQLVRLFWARRDPTPDTDLNEARRDFEQRVAYADQQWTTDETPGAMSDRGRVLILLGPPKRLQRPGAGGSSTGGDFGSSDSPFDTGGSISSGGGPGAFGRGGATDRAGVASEERWVYEDEAVPSFVDRKRFEVRFLSKPGSEEVELTAASQVMGFLLAAREGWITRPELTAADLATAAPAASGIATTAAAGEVGLAVYRGETLAAAAVEPLRAAVSAAGGGGVDAHLAAGAFQASDGRWIVPVQVAVNGEPPAGDGRVVGELLDAEGASKLAFRFEQPWQESRGQRYVKDTLVVPEPGEYELRAGLEGPGGEIVWAANEPVSVPAGDGGFWVSELVLSDNIFPMQEAQQMLEPWAWQGIVVVPKAGSTFPQGGLLWFYVHACDPQLGENGQPSLRANAVIDGPKRFRAPLTATPAKAGDHCWVIASGMDLVADTFPAGDYTVKLQVRDSLAGVTLSTDGAFTVAAP